MWPFKKDIQMRETSKGFKFVIINKCDKPRGYQIRIINKNDSIITEDLCFSPEFWRFAPNHILDYIAKEEVKNVAVQKKGKKKSFTY